jgi:hypothetical protein
MSNRILPALLLPSGFFLLFALLQIRFPSKGRRTDHNG